MANYTTAAIVAVLTGKEVGDIQAEWLSWADEYIEEKTDMSYFPAIAETLMIDGNGLDLIEISKKPIIEITQIVITSAGIETYTYSGDDIANYFAIYEDEGFVAFKELDIYTEPGEFSKGYENIEVTGKFGYTSVPKFVEELATLLVIRTMIRKYPGLEVNSEKIGDYSVAYKKNGSSLDKSIDDLFDLLIGEKDTHLEISD